MAVFGAHDDARRAFARHQPVALVERGVEREVNAVDPVIFARGAVAYIFDLEADRHGAARRHFFGQGEFGYTQVGFGIDDREARLAKIALRQFERIFGELTEQSAVAATADNIAGNRVPAGGIGDHIDIIFALDAGRHREIHRAAIAFAAAQRAVGHLDRRNLLRPRDIEYRILRNPDIVGPVRSEEHTSELQSL